MADGESGELHLKRVREDESFVEETDTKKPRVEEQQSWGDNKPCVEEQQSQEDNKPRVEEKQSQEDNKPRVDKQQSWGENIFIVIIV